MSKKEVLGVVLAGLFNFLVYDAGAHDFQRVSSVYNNIYCKMNPGRKENERRVSVTVAVDSDLVAEHGRKELFNSLENILATVSKKSEKEFGIKFEIRNEFVYNAEEHIYGSIRVEEASLKIPKSGSELRIVYTKRPINYYRTENGDVNMTLGMAPINHNICLIYFKDNFSDLTNTTLHEFLHSFGAEHVENEHSLMYPDNSCENPIIDAQTLETVLHYKNKKFF